MIDLTKPVQTRDGRKARIVCADRVSTGGDRASVVALVMLPNSTEAILVFGKDGAVYGGGLDSPSSLINVPERKELFFNSYRSSIGETYHSLDMAKGRKTNPALAVCKMTLEAGIPVSVEVVEKYDG